MKNLFFSFFGLLLTVAFISSCKKLDDGMEDTGPTKISLADTVSLIVGDVYQVPVTITPTNYDKAQLVWKSSDTTVLSISSTGKVVAKKAGKSNVIVSNKQNAISVSCLVTVKAKIVVVTPPRVDSLKIGLLAYYQFNNSGVDSSGNGNDVSYYRNTTATANRFGKANSAFAFDGVTSYMMVKDNVPLRLNNTDYTLNLWVSQSEYNNSYGIELLCKRGAGNANGWNHGITGKLNQLYNGTLLGAATMTLSGGGDPTAVSNKIIALNEWHMITTVYSLSKKQISFYVDGVLTNTVSDMPTPSATANADLIIGQDSQDVNATSYYLKGKLDDVRVYSRALSVKDIAKLYTSTN